MRRVTVVAVISTLPSWALLSQARPAQAQPTQAQPTQAQPTQAHATQREPSPARPSTSEVLARCEREALRAYDLGLPAVIDAYDRAAERPACAPVRATLLYNAAHLARERAERGQSGVDALAAKCALRGRYDAILAAGPEASLALEAQAGRRYAATLCASLGESAPVSEATDAEAPTAGPGGDEASSTDKADTPRAVIEAASPSPLPAFARQTVTPPAPDDYTLFGVSSLAFVGAGLAYLMLLDADADRQTARDSVGPGSSVPDVRLARGRFDTANTRANVAGWTATTLAATGAITATWGLIELWLDDGATADTRATDSGALLATRDEHPLN